MAVVGLVFAVAVAGCTTDGNENPVPTEPASTDTTPDVSLKPTAEAPTNPTPDSTPWPEPTRPPEMAHDDIEGAKAAAVYFLELYTYLYISGDVSAWNEFSHDDCQFCAAVVSRTAEVHKDDGYSDGPVLEVLEIWVDPPQPDYEFFSVTADVNESPSNRFDATGEILDSTDGGPKSVDLALLHDGERWYVRGAVVNADESGGAE